MYMQHRCTYLYKHILFLTRMHTPINLYIMAHLATSGFPRSKTGGVWKFTVKHSLPFGSAKRGHQSPAKTASVLPAAVMLKCQTPNHQRTVRKAEDPPVTKKGCKKVVLRENFANFNMDETMEDLLIDF